MLNRPGFAECAPNFIDTLFGEAVNKESVLSAVVLSVPNYSKFENPNTVRIICYRSNLRWQQDDKVWLFGSSMVLVSI